MGDRFTQGALLILVATLSHGSPVAVSLMAAATFAPGALFGWFTGVLVDRMEKRTSMILADVVRFALILIVFFVHSFAWLLALGFLVRLMWNFYFNAYDTLMPAAVGEGDALLKANAVDQTAANVIDLLGYGLAGVFIFLVGVRPAFMFDAATYLVSALLIFFVPLRMAGMKTLGKVQGFFEDLKEGVHAVTRLSVPRSLLAQLGIACLPIGVFNALLILLLPDVYHVTTKLYPYLAAVQGVSMAVGGSLMAKWADRLPKRHMINIGLAGTGVTTALIGIVPSYMGGLVLYFIMGFFNIAFLIPILTWYQQSVPATLRGRGMSVYSAVTNLALLISTLAAGPLGVAVGVSHAVFVSGLVFALVGILGYAFKVTRPEPTSITDTQAG